MTRQLTVRTRTTAAGPVVAVAGELDHLTAPEVRAVLPGLALCPGQQLVVDLGSLTFCDSTGITVLLAARNHALAAQATIALAAVPDRAAGSSASSAWTRSSRPIPPPRTPKPPGAPRRADRRGQPLGRGPTKTYVSGAPRVRPREASRERPRSARSSVRRPARRRPWSTR